MADREATAARAKPSEHDLETWRRTEDTKDKCDIRANSQEDLISNRPARRQRTDGLAIGGTLTAALVGGALVFENLASARDASTTEAATSTATEIANLHGLDAAVGNSAATAASRQHGQQADDLTEDSLQAADDLLTASPLGEAEPSQNAGAIRGADVQRVGEGSDQLSPVAELPDSGSSAALNFINIEVGDGNGGGGADLDADPFVDDPVISRNRIVGTPGDDVLIGGDGDDLILGASGNDIIHGNGGSDVLLGHEGNDELHGGTGRDRLDGGAGNDFLEGGADDDLDILRGGSGDDTLVMNSVLDVPLERTTNAGQGNDSLFVRESYAQSLPGGIDSSTFVFGDNFGEALPAGSSAYRQQLSNGIENLTLEGSADLDIFAAGNHNQLTGNAGDNLIHAGAGDDVVRGGAGDDVLSGAAGDDTLRGDSGNDHLSGGQGTDELYGGAGNDTFRIGLSDNGIDSVFDHEGANRLVLEGVGSQTVEASLLGNDLYVSVDEVPVARISDYVGHEQALSGIDFGQGLRTVDSLLVGHTDLPSAIAAAEADAALAAGDDVLSAHLHLSEPSLSGDNSGNRPMVGTDGDDWISGLGGQDHLYGGAGDDILEGGDGSDQLTGGAGNDRYLFASDDSGLDRIRDTEGRNIAELDGFSGSDFEAAVLRDDLAVLADSEIVFVVEDFVGNEGAFVGIQSGNRFIPTDDLLA
ncbi:MAG: calcium-binding protein [Geminicoccaceae bacterium]